MRCFVRVRKFKNVCFVVEIEPALREKLDPKSSASASSATGAFAVAKVSIKNETTAMYILFFMQNVQKSGAKAAETVSES